MASRQVASQPHMELREIKLAHSPDSDDAFMFYALATHKLSTPGYKYTHVLSDIQSLNEAALLETYDVTAVSFAAYPSCATSTYFSIAERAFGEGYGPIVVATHSMKPQELHGKRIGVPGLKTSAYLDPEALSTRISNRWSCRSTKLSKRFEIMSSKPGSSSTKANSSSLNSGLHRVIDLGIWWQELTSLPLPLGGNAVRRALGPELGRTSPRRFAIVWPTAGAPRRSVELRDAICPRHGPEIADKFVGMYVNKWTLGYGEKGKKAVRELIERGTAAGLLPGPAEIEFLTE